MRTRRMLRAIRRTRRGFEDELTSRLLLATMLIPFVEVLLGWRAHTPFGVSLAVHAAILGVMIIVVFSPSAVDRQENRVPRAALWLPVPVLAVGLAILLNARSNLFYSAGALVEGMTVIATIHFAGCWLRRRALAPTGPSLVGPTAAYVTPLRMPWGRGWQGSNAVMASVRLSDALSTIVGWSVLSAWLLIALAYRPVVGPLLIIAGLLASMASVILIPDAFLTSVRRVSTRITRQAKRTHARHILPRLRRRS